ncbi:hypothetical protein [Halomonas sp. hl-4]|uniref:hypothetical protein n=1 Tax=Halomonas sp. hl-4 TaxID=1761789 RepID=UPI001E3025DB|nr:hypothetical protein [Halomonas sp. hl-4]
MPELKRMGQAVLVITQDDRYFHLAGRLKRLESGKLLTAASETAEESLAEPSPAS